VRKLLRPFAGAAASAAAHLRPVSPDSRGEIFNYNVNAGSAAPHRKNVRLIERR